MKTVLELHPLAPVVCTAAAAFLLGASAGAQVDVGPKTRVDTGRFSGACNETTMSASYSNPLEVVAGWNDMREGLWRTGIGLSLDGGVTWTDFLMRPAPPNQSTVEGDPMTCFDHRTGTLWAGGMSFGVAQGGIFVARKDPGSATFGTVTMARISSSVDKGWMCAGVDPNDPTKSIVYCAYNQGLIRSVNMGDNWTAPLSLGGGLGFNPKTGPGGELYVAYWDAGTHMYLRRSFDGGATISAPILVATRLDVWGVDATRVPGEARVVSLAGLAVDQVNGNLYYVYPDTTAIVANGYNLDIYFSKSTNQGASWTTPVVINTDATVPGDQVFPWIEVDQQGRIHMLFYDSRGVVQNDTNPVGFFDAYYSYSDDAGASWTEIELTPTPMRTDQAFPGGSFIGDYLGLSTAGRRTLPLYMDTANGNADLFTHVIRDGPATEYCFGIGCPCGNDDPDAGCGNLGIDSSTATGSRLHAQGTNSVAADDLVLAFDGVKANLFGLVFRSTVSGSLPFGDGKRCLTGALHRFPPRQANASGIISYGPGEIVGLDGATVGVTHNYQGWYRDPLGPCGTGFNVSSAVTVQWE